MAYGKTPHERFNAIISYALVEDAERIVDGMGEAYVSYLDRAVEPPDYDEDSLEHHNVLLAAARLKMAMHSIKGTLQDHAKAAKHVAAFEARNGKDPRVRVDPTFCFEARDGNGMRPAELAVLCAIYSRIGSKKKPVRITRDSIRRRAAGFKSKAAYEADGGEAVLLSTREVRTLIDRLHARRLFAKYTYMRRQMYFSHRMSDVELRTAVVNTKTYQERHEAEHRNKDRETDRIIREMRQQLRRV